MQRPFQSSISRRLMLEALGLSAGSALLGDGPLFSNNRDVKASSSTSSLNDSDSLGPIKQIDAGVLNVGY